MVQWAEPGRANRQLHDMNVVGTLGLLTAAAGLPELEAVVVRGSAAIYGAAPAAPAAWRETDLPQGGSGERLPSRFQRDVAEIEQLVEVFARRHHGVSCTVLRVQPVVGGVLETPVSQLLRARVVPTYLGWDPRLQVVHVDDLVDALAAAALRPVRGVVNVGAPGPVSLSRALRRLRRPTLPIAGPLHGPALRLAARAGLAPRPSADIGRFLRYGRVVDLGRQREELGFTPRRSTLEALESAARGPHALAGAA